MHPAHINITDSIARLLTTVQSGLSERASSGSSARVDVFGLVKHCKRDQAHTGRATNNIQERTPQTQPRQLHVTI